MEKLRSCGRAYGDERRRISLETWWTGPTDISNVLETLRLHHCRPLLRRLPLPKLVKSSQVKSNYDSGTVKTSKAFNSR